MMDECCVTGTDAPDQVSTDPKEGRSQVFMCRLFESKAVVPAPTISPISPSNPNGTA
jgi:hypothetical protein